MCLRTCARSLYASTLSDQGLRCSLNELLDITECMNGEQRSRYHAHIQDDLNLHFWRMFEGTFSPDAVHGVYYIRFHLHLHVINANPMHRPASVV